MDYDSMLKQERDKFNVLYGDTVRKEKNTYVFKYNGFDCAILRHSGHLNGYVAIPQGHEFRGLDYYSRGDKELSEQEKYINGLEVHGGLTFAGDLSISVEGYDFTFCFGFDTAHMYDCFSDGRYASCPSDGTYRDYEYVRNEVCNLTNQIKAYDTVTV